MLKIGILTFHNVHNYGGVLQAYALQSFINKNFSNVTAEVIDYKSKKIEYQYSFKKLFKKPHLITVKAPILAIRKYYFNKFVKNNIVVSERSFHKNNINKSIDEYQGFIVGSDQVWNHTLTGGDLTYLLDFVQDRGKFSYAASFGLSTISKKYRSDYKRLLSKFTLISVREELGAELLKNEFGISDSFVNVDPTLLLTKEEWKRLIPKKNKYKDKKYVLIYTIRYSERIVKLAKLYANHNNLEIIYLGTLKPILGVKFIPATEVENYLDLFLNAQAVFTNSFHGTVFSILFHKKMQIELPYTDGRNSRIENLVKLCNLESQVISTNEKPSIINNQINWEYIDNQISEERNKSLDYIQRIIKCCNREWSTI